MSYLLTNSSALTALQNLTMTQQSLSQTQSQLSTGLAIQNASDNSSYWSIAQTMSSDNGALGAVSASLKQTAAMLSTTSSAISQAISIVNNIKTQVMSAENPGASLDNIANTLTQLGNQLLNTVSSSTVNGVNLLDGSHTGETEAFTAGYTDNVGKSASAVITISLKVRDLTTTGQDSPANTGILEAAQGDTEVSASNLTKLGKADIETPTATTLTLSNIDKAIAELTSYASNIGDAQTSVTQQQNFIAIMQTNLSNGVAALVDADMNQVSTRLQALQTQQQLGVQSLSIANQSSQMILKLFQ